MAWNAREKGVISQERGSVLTEGRAFLYASTRDNTGGEKGHAHSTLGTGTPNPSLKRMSSGCLVETGEDVIVFDHGPGAFHRLLESGIEITRVSHLLLSHLHYDHCLDYARLVLTRWDQAAVRIPELKVYGPAYVRKMTNLLFGEGGVFDPDLIARTQHEPSVQTYISRGAPLRGSDLLRKCRSSNRAW